MPCYSLVRKINLRAEARDKENLKKGAEFNEYIATGNGNLNK